MDARALAKQVKQFISTGLRGLLTRAVLLKSSHAGSVAIIGLAALIYVSPYVCARRFACFAAGAV